MIYAALVLLFALAAVAFLLYRGRKEASAGSPQTAARQPASAEFVPAEPASAEDLRLTQVEVVIAGDSLGCFYRWAADLQADGRVKVKVESQPTHSDRCKTTTRSRNPQLMARLQQVFVEANMEAWPQQPQSEIFALDAATTSLYFTFDGKAGVFRSTQQYPEDGHTALLQLREIMEAAVR